MSYSVRSLFRAAGALVCLSLTAAVADARPVTVTIVHLEQIGDDFDANSWGDFYSRMTIAGNSVESASVDYIGGPFDTPLYPSGPLLRAPWVLTQNVPDSATTVTLTIEIIDDDYPDGDQGADLNPRSDKDVLGLTIDLTTGKWTGDLNWPENCISGGNTPLSVAICFDMSALSASGDADEDGLLDGWELNGYNADGNDSIDVNLPALGANPQRKDLFVEIDCLVAGNHSHCPSAPAIAQAVRSFVEAPVANPDATSGVQLHVDLGALLGANTKTQLTGAGGATGSYGDLGGGGDQIPEAGNEFILSFDAEANESGASATDIRDVYFNDHRNLISRYALFGHQRTPAYSCFSGVSYVPGNIFLVTLGGVRGSATGSACFGTDTNGFSVGSTDEQTGAFMHEFGHSIGLEHDGDQANFNGSEVHGKPNYISVMNYGFGWNFCGLPTNPAGGLLFSCDYSRATLPPLNETALDECAGQDGGAHGLGPMNWNGGIVQGATCLPPNTANVVADVNLDGVCVAPGDAVLSTVPQMGSDDLVRDNRVMDGPNRSCSTTAAAGDVQVTPVGQMPAQPNQLTGYDDWSNLQYGLLGLGASAGGSSVAVEPSVAEIESAREYQSMNSAPAIVVSKTGPATGRPGDVLSYTIGIDNNGRGPAIAAVLTDVAPDGGEQVSDLGVIKLGDSLGGGSTFTVPAGACPGDYTAASASVKFVDIVGKKLQASGSAPLQILDVSAPLLEVSVSPSVLWPAPNHKLEGVTASVRVSDNCDSSPVVTLVSVTSNEPETGVIGAMDKSPDIAGAGLGTDDRSFFVRAERGTSGHANGRIYTITYRAVDASGNGSEATATVTVPRDNSGSL